MLIFFLNMGFYYNAVEYRHQYLNRQQISKRKNACFMEYKRASPAEPLSETSGSRASVQPAKSALPIIKLLCEVYPKIYAFSAHKIFTTFCAPFLNRISDFKVLAMP